MHRFRIGTQLLIVASALVVGFCLFGLAAWQGFDKVKIGSPAYQRIILSKDLVADILPPPAYIIESYLTVLQVERAASADERGPLFARLDVLRREYDERFRFWQQQKLPAALEQRFMQDAHSAALRFYDLAGQLKATYVSGDRNKANALLAEITAAYTTHRRAIDDVVKMATALQTENETEAADHLASIAKILVAIFAGSLLLAVFANTLFGRSLKQGLAIVTARLQKVAERNFLPSDEGIDRRDEIGDVLRHLNTSTAALRDPVMNIRAAANTVASAAQQLSSSTTQLSANFGVQASGVQQIVASLNDITESVAAITARSGDSKELAGEAGERCAAGSREVANAAHVVQQLADDVQRTAQRVSVLGERSKEVANVASTIRQIADQTNLLALNAAIEAARAGEAGRGFAVVADEVRKLAESTTKATDHIASVLGNIETDVLAAVAGMDEGSRRALVSIESVRGAEQTVSDLAAKTGQLVEVAQAIAADLEQQLATCNAIRHEVTTLARTASENSQASDQIAGTAQHMIALATSLEDQAQVFRL